MSGVYFQPQFSSPDTPFYGHRQISDTNSVRDGKCRRMKFQWSMHGALNQQRSTNQFCDVKLRVRDRTVSAHRCVLAGASDYFDRLLCSNFKEKEEAEIDFSAMFTSIVPLIWVINYIYGVELYLNEEYMLEILNASRLFLLDQLTTALTSHLCYELTLRNCMWTWAVADLYDLALLCKICQHIVTCRFQDVLQHTDEALAIPPAFLVRFVGAGITQHCLTEEIEHFLDRWARSGGTPEHEKTKSYITSRLLHDINSTGKFLTFGTLAKTTCIRKSRKRNFEEIDKKVHNDKRKRLSLVPPCRQMADALSPVNQMVSDSALPPGLLTVYRPHEQEPEINRFISRFPPSMKYWKKSCSAEMTKGPCEEILICNREHDLIIYRPESNKWLCVSHTSRIPNWFDRNILLGVGESFLYLFKSSYPVCVLENIMDGERIQLTECQNMESPKFFSLKGALFSVGFRSSGFESFYQTSSMCMYRIAVMVYIASENCWGIVCESDEVWSHSSSRLFLIQPKSDQIDILLDTTKHNTIAITVYRFHPNLGSLTKKSIVSPDLKQNLPLDQLISVQQTAEGYLCSYMFLETSILFTDSKNELTPVDSESMVHSIAGNDGNPASQCFMNTYGAEIFSLFPGREMCYDTLCAFRKEENKYYRIIPCPAYGAQHEICSHFVASEFLNHLQTLDVNFDLDAAVIEKSTWLRQKWLHFSVPPMCPYCVGQTEDSWYEYVCNHVSPRFVSSDEDVYGNHSGLDDYSDD